MQVTQMLTPLCVTSGKPQQPDLALGMRAANLTADRFSAPATGLTVPHVLQCLHVHDSC